MAGCTSAPPDEYSWTICTRRRWGLASNQFDRFNCWRWPLLEVRLSNSTASVRPSVRPTVWLSISIDICLRRPCEERAASCFDPRDELGGHRLVSVSRRDAVQVQYMLPSCPPVHPCVCHKLLYSIETTGRIKLILHCILKAIRVFPKIRILPCKTLTETLYLENWADRVVNKSIVLSTNLVDGRACWPHLRQLTSRGCFLHLRVRGP